MRLTLTALLAIFALGAMAASSASAHPLFLTESGKELLFSGTNPAGTIVAFRSLDAGIFVTITCERISVDGFALTKSPLAHRVGIEFSGKCGQTIGEAKTNCVEPIIWKMSLAELGLVLGNKTVGILLAPSDGTKTFAETSCGGSETAVEGAVIGEIPELNRKVENQYNNKRSEYEVPFEAEDKSNDNQNITSIELLGTNMTSAELKVSGFFGGKESLETTVLLKGNGKIEICTKATSACP